MKRIKFLFLFVIFLVTGLGAQPYVLKIATLAPEGSFWMKSMHQFNQEIDSLTEGAIKFRVYPGGIAGGEKDVLRKIRFGQLHCASVTGIGLGEILPEVRVLEIPFLFKSTREIDYVYPRMFAYFEPGFEEKGFILLGWSEVGFVYVFTREKIQGSEDFKHIRMWLWEEDILARETFKILGISPIPLEIMDVYTALQTGMIDGFYNSPMGAIALQWFTEVNYMLDYPMTNSVGGIIISARKFRALPVEYQNLLKEKTREYMQHIIEKSRELNQQYREVLKQNGVQILKVNSGEIPVQLQTAGEKLRKKLVGKLYSRATLDTMLQLLEEFRNQDTEIH